MAALDIAGTIVGASTATAGLILVFIGTTTAAYESYQAQERRTVKARYRKRAYTAFVALIVSISAVVFGLLADWLDAPGLAVVSFGFLVLSLLGVLWASYVSISEIK